MGFGSRGGVQQRFDALLHRRNDFTGRVALIAQRILRHRFTQAFEHPVVVHDQAKILAGIAPISAGDRLHQGVRLHRFIEVEGREAFHVETGQPHGADNGDAERMRRIFKGGFHIYPLTVRRLETLLHRRPVGDDVEAPLFEIGDFVLRLADDDFDEGLVQPLRLGQQAVALGLEQLPGVSILLYSDGRFQ